MKKLVIATWLLFGGMLLGTGVVPVRSDQAPTTSTSVFMEVVRVMSVAPKPAHAGVNPPPNLDCAPIEPPFECPPTVTPTATPTATPETGG